MSRPQAFPRGAASPRLVTGVGKLCAVPREQELSLWWSVLLPPGKGAAAEVQEGVTGFQACRAGAGWPCFSASPFPSGYFLPVHLASTS